MAWAVMKRVLKLLKGACLEGLGAPRSGGRSISTVVEGVSTERSES